MFIINLEFIFMAYDLGLVLVSPVLGFQFYERKVGGQTDGLLDPARHND